MISNNPFIALEGLTKEEFQQLLDVIWEATDSGGDACMGKIIDWLEERKKCKSKN